ncbi:MAG: hypothetical protein RMJ67_06445 [Elusimicrobiota bacterium]|nr:hypothetical protein [Endomicrobiia bacterium]MDW8166133.1 hypothetical protein [Elusimicrobiota bacterium]
MKILQLKLRINPQEWIKKFYKNFHNTLYKDGIILGKILNIDNINNIIEIELKNFDLEKISKYISTTKSDLAQLEISWTPVITIGAIITTYLIAKGLTKQFQIISSEIKEITKPILNPINLFLIATIIFLLSGGLKLFKKDEK